MGDNHLLSMNTRQRKPVKAKLVEHTVEGFTACLVIQFDDGFELRSPKMTWMTKAEKEKMRARFDKVVADINNGLVQIR